MPGILFRRATVVDGSGSERFEADVVVEAGVIQSIRREASEPPSGLRVIESQGWILSPGFIDMHAHSDLAIITNPDHNAKVTQGVTTELVGQDGLGYVPADPSTLARVRRQIAGWNGDPAELALDWGTVTAYLEAIDDRVATNIATLVPQGNLRLMTVGDENRPATASEISAMKGILERALDDGAVGMSSGLSYVPGMFASTDELVALCEVVADRGGFFAPHARSYGLGVLESYAEMIEIARRSGCPVHLTHATMNFAPNRGKASELIALVDAALAEGIDVTLDSYPYLAGSTTLAALLPSWATAGGLDATLARLDDAAERERIRVAVEIEGSDGCHGMTIEWHTIQVAGVVDADLDQYVGRRLGEIAGQAGIPPIDVFFDLLRRDRLATSILQHVGDEENVQAIMRHRAHMAGSDGLLVGARPHPRAWGTFPRYLSRYSRELGVFGLEECVNHLTGRAAARLGLRDRGLLREGFAADLVMFNAATIHDQATPEQPTRPPTGIRFVLVNGEFAVDEGERTPSRSGRALRG